ncbi:Las1-like-domain-containing protein [Blastocladiella britannica]|nr:Las1-like-domain-containing protein [Blastocladiella britannica]
MATTAAISLQPRLVPWSSQDEWALVRSWLLARDPRGVDRVAAWLARAVRPGASGGVPSQIVATAALVEVECAYDASGAFTPEPLLRSLYALAIVRFVNGVVDPAQRKTYAQSVASLAERAGLPAWLVDLRHQATHDAALPSLPILRAARDAALEWLQESYWDAHANAFVDAKAELTAQLTAYKQARREMLRQMPGPRTAAAAAAAASAALQLQKEQQRRLDDLLTPVIGALDASMVGCVLIPLLLEPGLLVPANQRVLPVFPALLAPTHIAIWEPLLQILQSKFAFFVPELLAAILEKLTECNQPDSVLTRPSVAAALSAWYRHLMPITRSIQGTSKWGNVPIPIEIPWRIWLESTPKAQHPVALLAVAETANHTMAPSDLAAIIRDRTVDPQSQAIRDRIGKEDGHIRLLTLDLSKRAPPPVVVRPAPPGKHWTRVTTALYVRGPGTVPLGLLPDGRLPSLALDP